MYGGLHGLNWANYVNKIIFLHFFFIFRGLLRALGVEGDEEWEEAAEVEIRNIEEKKESSFIRNDEIWSGGQSGYFV